MTVLSQVAYTLYHFIFYIGILEHLRENIVYISHNYVTPPLKQASICPIVIAIGIKVLKGNTK